MSRILALTVVVAWAAASAAPASGAVRFGLNDDPEHVIAAGNLIERSGASVVRVPVYWPEIEPTVAAWQFAKYDVVYERLLAAGAKPLFVVHGTPVRDLVDLDDTQASSDRGPRDAAAWQRLWRTLAARYPAAKLQVWNEPNLWPYGSIEPQRMAHLTNLAAVAVSEVRRGTKIVGPAPAPTDGWRGYTRTLYANTARNVEVGLHLYPRVPTRWRTDFRNDLRFTKKIAGERRVWITETGLSRSQYGRALQRRGSLWILDRARRAGVASVVFHRLVRREGAGAWDRGLAMTDRRLRPLPVFKALRRAVARQRAQ